MAVTSSQDLPLADRDRESDGAAVRSHLAEYYGKLNETPPWEDEH